MNKSFCHRVKTIMEGNKRVSFHPRTSTYTNSKCKYNFKEENDKINK